MNNILFVKMKIKYFKILCKKNASNETLLILRTGFEPARSLLCDCIVGAGGRILVRKLKF